MRKSVALVAALGLVFVAGCGGKKDEDKATDETTEEQTDEPEEPEVPEEPETPDEPEDPSMANKMANCPNAVEGASTEIADGDGAVLITITAEDEAAVTAIRERSAHLDEVDDAESDEIDHSGEGTGGGGLGKCPVVMEATDLEVEEVEGGVKLTLAPTDEGNLEDLTSEVTRRNDNLPEAMEGVGDDSTGAGGGVGGGGGTGTGGGGGGGR